MDRDCDWVDLARESETRCKDEEDIDGVGTLEKEQLEDEDREDENEEDKKSTWNRTAATWI
ncbi:hypothetical protein FRB94_011343 [Tulasnella sp. JGI-2019a]|nr:hypothetical protein FRB93_003279 [Tulasnella sp. JGI-2019a]KAG9009897.1 hypothetical protein FRB94_011343 [Tulasnella sp. JGI-2019a]